MTKPHWQNGYSGQTLDELLALENDYAAESLLHPIELAIEQKLERAEDEETVSQEEWTILAVEALEREVNNGGYSQFFLNSSRAFTPIILDSLLRIGCTEAAKITEKALKAAGLLGLRREALKEALDSYETEWYSHNKQRIVNFAQIAKSVEPTASAQSRPEDSVDWSTREKELDDCDRLFYQCPESIGGRLFEFVKANRHAIQF